MTSLSFVNSRHRTPWHLWVVGIAAVMWNGFGAYDYLMTNTRGAAYLREMGMTSAQIGYFEAMPAWMTAAWAVGVWGGLAGALLLIARSRWAVWVFAASLLALLLSVLYTFALSDGAAVNGSQGMVQYGLITAGAVFFLWYSGFMRRRGVLR